MIKTSQRTQTIAPHSCEALRLRGFAGVASPYFSRRDIRLVNTTMRVIVERYDQGLPGHLFFAFKIMNGTSEVIDTDISVDVSAVTTRDQLQTASLNTLDAYLTTNSWNRSDGIVWPFIDDTDINALITAALPGSPVESSLSLSVQTSTGAVGTQVSSTKNAWVTIAGNVSTTASIAGAASGDLIVEVAPTNSATPSDWVEKGRIGNSQTLTLALTLQSVQIVKGQVVAFVPAGYFIKARSSGSGTVSYTLDSVRKVLL